MKAIKLLHSTTTRDEETVAVAWPDVGLKSIDESLQ